MHLRDEGTGVLLQVSEPLSTHCVFLQVRGGSGRRSLRRKLFWVPVIQVKIQSRQNLNVKPSLVSLKGVPGGMTLRLG